MDIYEVGYQVKNRWRSMTPDSFLRMYHELHPQGPRVAIYDHSDTKTWKRFVPLTVVLADGETTIGHVDYVHYKLLTEDDDGRSGDH